MQGRIQRTGWHLDRSVRYLLNAVGDGAAVAWLQRHRLQDQQVQRALRQVEFGGHGELSPLASIGRYHALLSKCKEKGARPGIGYSQRSALSGSTRIARSAGAR